MNPRLVVFAKAPRMGAAKTRLAAGVGTVHAQRLYRAMTGRVLRSVVDPRWETILAVTPDGASDPVWGDQSCVEQGEGGLSERLIRAMAHRGPVCVIGTDCPEVTGHDIAEAFSALRGAELVLGPADDGGFWLIGARGPVGSDLFACVRWSTEHALVDVERNVQGRVARLRTLTDVDDVESLRDVRARGVRI